MELRNYNDNFLGPNESPSSVFLSELNSLFEPSHYTTNDNLLKSLPVIILINDSKCLAIRKQESVFWTVVDERTETRISYMWTSRERHNEYRSCLERDRGFESRPRLKVFRLSFSQLFKMLSWLRYSLTHYMYLALPQNIINYRDPWNEIDCIVLSHAVAFFFVTPSFCRL